MLMQADARHIPLADESVHLVCTSPPYWGLRDYGLPPSVWGGDMNCEHQWGNEIPGDPRGGSGPGAKECYGGQDGKTNYARQVPRGSVCLRCSAWRGVLGLEPTPELYVQHLVEIFQEVRRVLRTDGVCFVNIGDSYASQGGPLAEGGGINDVLGGKRETQDYIRSRRAPLGLKPKDLCLIPERLALALQADGWWVRSRICWAKKAPMPESVTDRPTSAWEHVWMLTKSERYYWDTEAVREPSESGPSDIRKMVEAYPRFGGKHKDLEDPLNKASVATSIGRRAGVGSPNGRNLRNFWILGPSPYPDAHFATFPPEIPKRCILAGTSARGCCPKCGAPWKRVVKPTGHVNYREPAHVPNNAPTKVDSTGWAPTIIATDRWHSTCRCDAGEPVPCTVLDPFAGSGTTVAVAHSLGRRGIGLELKWEYLQLAQKRLSETPSGLPIA